MEEWRAIIGHDGYEVSNLGNVRSPRGVLKPFYGGPRRNYAEVSLPTIKHAKLHYLVAQAFIPNPDGKTTIDHIDRNPANNVVSNLRWATYTEQNVNKRSSRQNTSGERNIRQIKNGSWEVQVRRDYKMVLNKCFATLAEAVEARDKV